MKKIFKHHDIDMPDHPLIGRVVAVRAIVFTSDPSTEKIDPECPPSLALVYDDGRIIEIDGTGYESDGLAIEVERVKRD